MSIPLVILAGGLGTRLQSVTNGKPKSLVDVNGFPFLYFLLNNWVNQGIDNFIFSLHFESNQIIEYIESQKTTLLKGCTVRYIIEEELLGTGGAISFAIKQESINGFFLIANGDTYLSNGINELKSLNRSAIAAVDVVDASRFGTLNILENGQIIEFLEKDLNHKSGKINAGLYLLHSNDFELINKKKFSIETELFPVLAKNKSIWACSLDAEFIDIGVPIDYHRFCKLNLK
jgi:D-glycero-alpha-D-manno-heptose 1-phosphate guanylyltransferase